MPIVLKHPKQGCQVQFVKPLYRGAVHVARCCGSTPHDTGLHQLSPFWARTIQVSECLIVVRRRNACMSNPIITPVKRISSAVSLKMSRSLFVPVIPDDVVECGPLNCKAPTLSRPGEISPTLAG